LPSHSHTHTSTVTLFSLARMFSPSKLFTAALVLAMMASPAQAAIPSCRTGSSKVRLRKEWRTLSPERKTTYFKAFDAIIASGFFDELAHTHELHNYYIHSNPLFLPWHRAFTVVVETEMRKTAGDDFALPFWDWGYDSQAPELSPHWGDDKLSFGRGGDPNNNGCVTTGHFKDHKPKYTDNGCITRDFTKTIDPLTSTDVLNKLMSGSKDYDSFRRNLEGRPHASVHVQIGGDMAYMISPTDPVFFLHHAMVDKVWNDWQKLKPENKNDYQGTQVIFGSKGREKTETASRDHILHPYTEWKVSNTFETEVLCFKYVDLDVNDIAVNNMPPPTVKASPTKPSAPSKPTPNTTPAPKPSRDDDRKPSGDKKTKKSIGMKIKNFFKGLINESTMDPSQVPGGTTTDPTAASNPIEIDDKVKFSINESAPTEVVAKTDRSELLKLREQPPIPARWLELNHINVNEVRGYEKKEAVTIQELNNVFGYVSPAALWNQPHKIAALSQHVPKFKATFSKFVVTVESETTHADPLQAVSNVHARVKLSIGLNQIQNVEKVKTHVTKIIGESAYGEHSVSNPYHKRHHHHDHHHTKTAKTVT